MHKKTRRAKQHILGLKSGFSRSLDLTFKTSNDGKFVCVLYEYYVHCACVCMFPKNVHMCVMR